MYLIGCGSLKRFIRYLYEYEQGKRIRNVGFVKVEQDEQECVVHVHGKGLRMGGQKKLGLYLFYDGPEGCTGLWQGEIDNINPAVNYRLHYTREDVGGSENFSRINGVIMSCGDGRKYASVWNDMPVDVDHMQIWKAQKDEKEPPKSEEAEPEEMSEMRPEAEPEEMPKACPEPEAEAEPESEPEAEPKSEMEGKPEPEMETGPEVDEEVIRPESMQFLETGTKASPWRVTKIQRKELARLPRCEWRLANNNFLLHGYYNYRHLVFIENDRAMYLGIPGIYHEKEAEAAGAWGFPDFVPVKELEVALTPEECEEEEQFGYWCRQVRHPFC